MFESELKNNNYVVIRNFISSYEAAQLAKDFKNHCNKENRGGDFQIPESQSEYNFIGFLELLCEKTPEISKFLGEKVLPTYSYARVYKKNAELFRHRDRESCEVSLTVHLSGDKDWPIYIQKPSGEEVEVTLNPGDALMYMGCIADHWRYKFDGDEYVQVFLHYVKSRGKNSGFAFDKKKEKEECEKPKTEFNKSVLTKTEVVVDESFSPVPLEDFIVSFDDIISDELCDLILNQCMNKEWGPTYVGNGIIDREQRNVDTILLSYKDFSIPENREFKEIDEKLFECAAKAIEKYNELFPDARIEEDSGYELLRYGEGQFYKKHTDSFKARPRSVSCSFALNDDYEGGEWGFFDNQIKIKPKKGSVVMFPSNFMYPHEINTVTKGTRYSIITWFI